MKNNQIPLIPQGTKLLVDKHELQAKLDNLTALYLANLTRLSVALNLMTAEQMAEYRAIVEKETQHNA